MPFGLGLRDIVGLVREAPVPARAIVVSGPRSDELAAEITRDGDRSLVRVGGDAAEASAFVLVGLLTEAGEAQLRRATRARVPVLALLLGDAEETYPYVLPEDVVVVADPDGPLPVGDVVERLAAVLGPDGIALAARLPVLRDAVSRRRTFEAVLGAASLTALSRDAGRPLLPVLALTQARTLRRLSFARGEPAPTAPAAIATTVAPELVASLAVGLACRTLVRHLPLRGRLAEGLVAGAGTLALASAARHLRVTG